MRAGRLLLVGGALTVGLLWVGWPGGEREVIDEPVPEVEATGGPLAMVAPHGPVEPLSRTARPFPESREGIGGEDLRVFVQDGRRRRIRLPLESVFLLPGADVDLWIEGGHPADVSVTAEAGTVTRTDTAAWNWSPPESGGHADLVLTWAGSDTTVLRAFRLVPRDRVQNGRIGGYHIGSYPTRPLRGNPIYSPPRGFVRVTPANRDVRVSPHFVLGQFTSKQSTTFPKYEILRPKLLLKLEMLLEALADRGYPVRSFHVMSGFRTPYYNVQVLGNGRYSRHQWGGAADIFVDESPKNGRMDDLNRDGRVNLRDIDVIADLVDRMEAEVVGFPVGGAGRYRANQVRGPFVHVDVRGARARW